MKNITVIGAGTMGNGIAHTYAQKDFNVKMRTEAKSVQDADAAGPDSFTIF